MQAINAHTKHKCRAISYKRTWLQYPYDILNPAEQELKQWLKWADVLNLHDEIDYGNVGKPIVATYHGSWYRERWETVNRRDKALHAVQTCLTADLSLYGPRWIGRAMPDMTASWHPAEEFTVVHSPTQPHRKGTDLVRKACQKLGLKLDVITKLTHTECLKRKAKGHVLVDQVGPRALGYGTSAVEAWALGMPVISGAPKEVQRQYLNLAGCVPFVTVADVGQIVTALVLCQERDSVYKKVQERGRQFWLKHHSPQAVALKFIEACNDARKVKNV